MLDWIRFCLCRRLGLWSDDDGPSFADTYHGKAVPLETAARLITLNRNIEIRDLEHVIPYARARDIVLKNPDRIVVMDCPCRASRVKPCLPLDVCLIVGEPFASFIAEHHPGRSRWITPEEAVNILEAEDRRGHVHHAFFKEAMLGRFYAICNCCSCCCGAMQAMRNGVPMLSPSGLLPQIDLDICQGCGKCVRACPFKALELVENFARVDPTLCMGCGVCVGQCPAKALRLVETHGPVQPLIVDRLVQASESTPAGSR
ncbi:MAG: 4Fe-4S dicluster domain-containing protein [Deltaproteobacteria bacterium]|nr:4Fe-4S dicluster domain-containing protein [Deltaproteobacteria bacterium]